MAIDIALEPDGPMIERARAANARLLEIFPQGFALDATHHPHVSTLQRYVRTADLDNVYAAVNSIMAGETPASWVLKAFKYYYLGSGTMGLAGIVAQPTDDLLRMQQQLIEAVAPFESKTGTAAAYYRSPGDPDIDPLLVEYVAAYVPMYSGKKFNPHVTIGLAPKEYLDKMLAEPFDAFTFSPAGASVYQLGNYGTARRKLKAWDFASQGATRKGSTLP